MDWRLTILQATVSSILKWRTLLSCIQKLAIPREHRARQKDSTWRVPAHIAPATPCWAARTTCMCQDTKTDATFVKSLQQEQCLKNAKWQGTNSLSFAPVALLTSNTRQERLDQLRASRPCWEGEKLNADNPTCSPQTTLTGGQNDRRSRAVETAKFVLEQQAIKRKQLSEPHS